MELYEIGVFVLALTQIAKEHVLPKKYRQYFAVAIGGMLGLLFGGLTLDSAVIGLVIGAVTTGGLGALKDTLKKIGN